jgi:hypothetical protein
LCFAVCSSAACLSIAETRKLQSELDIARMQMQRSEARKCSMPRFGFRWSRLARGLSVLAALIWLR